MGCFDGNVEGRELGEIEGVWLGSDDGNGLGSCVGLCDGIVEGFELGLSLNVAVGALLVDGASVDAGLFVGACSKYTRKKYTINVNQISYLHSLGKERRPIVSGARMQKTYRCSWR